MPGNGTAIGNNHPIPDNRVMGHMAARHKQPIVPHTGDTTATFGAAVHCHMFTDAIAFADHQPAGLALEFQILRNFANHRKRKDHRALRHIGLAGDHHMAFQHHLRPQCDLRSHHAKRTDTGAWINPRAILNHRRDVNIAHDTSLGKSSIAMNSASAAISPSTVATPENFQILPPGLPRRVFRSMRSTSPGSTLRRNLHLSIDIK